MLETKKYRDRLVKGKLLVQNYRNARYFLAEFCVKTLKDFPKLSQKQLSRDLKVKEVPKLISYYNKNKDLYKNKANETTFLKIFSAVTTYGADFKTLTKEKVQKSFNDIQYARLAEFKKRTSTLIAMYNTFNEDQKNEIRTIVNRLNNVLNGKFTILD